MLKAKRVVGSIVSLLVTFCTYVLYHIPWEEVW